jgi:hypoxanthine phosphoribosyltransferase
MPASTENAVRAPAVMIPAERVQTRIDELAAAIDRDYGDSHRLVCIGVLKGAVFFMTDLLKRLTVPVAVDFFQVTSYRGATTPGELRVRKDIDLPVRGQDVLIIEDIVDTGYTLRTILDMFRFRGARTVKLCALLDKRERREVEVTVDYCGFEIEDRFVVGYGLDFDERWRNLPYIGWIEPAAASSEASAARTPGEAR